MARTTIDPIPLPAPWATAAQAITWTPADVTNKNRFRSTGQEILLVRNTGTSPASFTVYSVPDSPYGRTAHLTQSVPAGAVVVTQIFPMTGWAQADNYIHVDGDNNLEFAVLRLR